MSENDGTYAALMKLQQERPVKSTGPKGASELPPKPLPDSTEDLIITPYISQNYRFTDDELRWVRQQAFKLTERFGTKITQNTILRVALASLRDLCDKNPKVNPLLEAISRFRK
jgi:hypothetical protein